ncbi:MAG: hypothetical protein FWG49_05375 [Leptospirales bacterium]|nr:hypothetical protein [Leptospirales bacterium]
MNNFKIFFFVILFNTMAMTALAESAATLTSPIYDDFTPEKISSFTCNLIKEGEYYRAYAELLRLNSFYPSYISGSTFDITASYLFYKGKRYNDLLELDLNETDKNMIVPLSIFRIDSLLKLNRRDDAAAEIYKLIEIEGYSEYHDYINKREVYLTALMNRDYDKKNDEFSDYRELFEYSGTVHGSMKRPFLGALAGIIPGMGYLYAGENGTALVSVIIIGAGSAVTYASYKTGWNTFSIISGTITFLFYGGSVVGGYLQCKKNNEYLTNMLEAKLARELKLDRDLEEVYFKFGLCFQ